MRLDVSKVTGRLFLHMNKQVLLLPVLVGLLQFAGWRTRAAEQRPEMAEMQANSAEKDKAERKAGGT
jgi:hypothetical protein